jgi:hypothetical protein
MLIKYRASQNKFIFSLIFFLSAAASLYAQQPAKADTIVPGKGSSQQQLKDIKQEKVKNLSDSTDNQPKKMFSLIPPFKINTATCSTTILLITKNLLCGNRLSRWQRPIFLSGHLTGMVRMRILQK